MTGKTTKAVMAIFAVALMMMVAFVPAISVLTDDGSDGAAATVSVSGNVYAANGTNAVPDGTKVYIDGTSPLLSGTTTGGAFTIKGVATGTIVVKVDISVWASGTNPVEGQTFPAITLTEVTGDKTGLKFVSGTVEITGGLVMKGTTNNVYLGGISINNSSTTMATTGTDGTYKFVATVGTTYTLTATAAGASFTAASFIASVTTAASAQNLVSEKYLLDATVSAPFGTLNTVTVTGTAGVTVGSMSFGVNGTTYHGYAILTFATTTETYVDAKVNLSYGYGITTSNDVAIAASATSGVPAAGNKTISLTSPGTVYTGTVTVGGISVTPAGVTMKSTVTVVTDPAYGKTVAANIVGGTYYVGGVYTYGTTPADDKKMTTNFAINAEFTGYTFNTLVNAGGNFVANNAVKVSGVMAPAGTVYTVSATNVVIKGEYKTGTNGAFEFFVPKGNSVTITAPDNYEPKVETYTAVNADTVVPTFTYAAEVTYTGQVLLNGVSIKLGDTDLKYSSTGIDGTYNGAVSFTATTDKAVYYSFTVRNIDSSKVFVKVMSASTGYELDTSAKAVKTGTTMTDIAVKASDMSATVKTNSTMGVSGMEVRFVMVSGNDTTYDSSKIVAELGKATTSATGVATLKTAALVNSSDSVNKYRIWAIPAGTSDFGTYTVKETILESGSASIATAEKTTFGFYTEKGTALSGFALSYLAYDSSDKLVTSGSAKIVGEKYYVITASSVSEVKVVPADVTKFVFSDGSTSYVTISSLGVQYDLKCIVKPVEPESFSIFYVSNVTGSILPNVQVVVLSDDSRISANNSAVYKKTEPQTVQITLVSKEMKVPLSQFSYGSSYADIDYSLQYSDVAVKVTLKSVSITGADGKVVNMNLDDKVYTFKASDNVTISAEVDISYEKIADANASTGGIDMNVMILGIAAVVIALLAVVYAVIRKN